MKRKVTSIWKRRGPPTLPRPSFWFLAEGRAHMGDLPKNTAMVALGSKLYMFGGSFKKSCPQGGGSETLPRDVYVIDAAENRPQMVKASCLLNWGKREPIAWTIHGKIYVMPHCLDHRSLLQPGKYFECYDPESNSWTILPNPHLRKGSYSYPISGDFRVVHGGKGFDDPLCVYSHAVVGSTLLISFASSKHGVVAFDTARIELGWRRILLQLIPSVAPCMLNFLPFDPEFATPIGENLVLCCPSCLPMSVCNFLRHEFGIDCRKDYYVCRFNTNALLGDNVGSDSDYVKVPVSITPLKGTMTMRWEKFVRYYSTASSYDGFGSNGLVLFLKVGYDYDLQSDARRRSEELPVNDRGDLYYSFEVFRVARSSDANNQQLQLRPCVAASSNSQPLPKGEYEAAGVSSALFQGNGLKYFGPPEAFRCFVMEDGVFVN